MFTIAVITIGQSPRPDITSDLRKLLPEGVCMTEYGALDGLTRQQAEEQFGYRGRGELLITRMGGSGSSLKVDGDSIMGQLQTCICRAQEDGADAALIACTGVFPDYEHQIPLLLPGEAQRKATMNLAGEQLMGVVIPKEHQREQIAGWWRESGEPMSSSPRMALLAADMFIFSILGAWCSPVNTVTMLSSRLRLPSRLHRPAA